MDITATYVGLSVTRRFNIAKQKQGVPGRTYFIELSANSLVRDETNTGYLTVYAYYRDGDSAERVPYMGRIQLQYSGDGSSWSDGSKSSADESSHSFPLSSIMQSSDIKYLRFILYEAGGTINMLDMQSVPITSDASALTHEQVFNALTNNGAIKGIYKEGDQLYISFSYAKGGELHAGGNNNKNGIIKALDNNDNPGTIIDAYGIHSSALRLYKQSLLNGIDITSNALVIQNEGILAYLASGQTKSLLTFDDNYNSVHLNGTNFYWNDEAIELGDSGWMTLSGNLSGLSDVTTPEYRKVNGQVFVRGTVKVNNTVSNLDPMGSPTQYQIGQLPYGYRPTKQTRIVCQTGGAGLFLLTVNSNGTVNVSRYQINGNYPSTIPSGTNFAFSVSFLAL